MTNTVRSLLAELIVVTKDWNQDDDISKSQKAKSIEIGKKLNELGGYDIMLVVCYAATKMNPVVATNLNYIWHGIGDWKM